MRTDARPLAASSRCVRTCTPGRAPGGARRVSAAGRARSCGRLRPWADRRCAEQCVLYARRASAARYRCSYVQRAPSLPRLPGRPPRRHLKETLGDLQVASVLRANAARLAGLVARRGQQPVTIRVPVRLRRGMHKSAGRTGSVSTALCSSCRRFLANTAASAVICHAYCFGPLSSAIERAHEQGKSAPA
jgi:hypothetical protein